MTPPMLDVLLVLALAILALIATLLLFARRRRMARQLYEHRLESALADGTLTADEVAELDRLRAQKDLTQAEVRMVARSIYRRALRDAARDQRLTLDEDAALRRLQVQLGLTEQDLGSDFTLLSRLRMLAQVEAGRLPVVDAPVALVANEQAHWVTQCTLADRLAFPRPGAGDAVGIVLPVGSADPFTAAGPRDALRPRDEIMPVDLGILIVTSRRTLFQGARRTVSVPHARLERFVVYTDGLRLDEPGGAARAFLLVEDPDLAAAILLAAARRRRVEIRPARPGRSA